VATGLNGMRIPATSTKLTRRRFILVSLLTLGEISKWLVRNYLVINLTTWGLPH